MFSKGELLVGLGLLTERTAEGVVEPMPTLVLTVSILKTVLPDEFRKLKAVRLSVVEVAVILPPADTVKTGELLFWKLRKLPVKAPVGLPRLAKMALPE